MDCTLGGAHVCPDGRASRYFTKAKNAEHARESGVRTVDAVHKSTNQCTARGGAAPAREPSAQSQRIGGSAEVAGAVLYAPEGRSRAGAVAPLPPNERMGRQERRRGREPAHAVRFRRRHPLLQQCVGRRSVAGAQNGPHEDLGRFV